MANVSSSNGLEKCPKLRFPGFDEPYRLTQLGNIASLVNRTDSKSNAPIMMLSAGNGFIMQSEKYSRDNAGQSLKKYILLKQGELAYNHGASKAKQFGCCYELTAPEARIPYVYHCFKINDYEYTPFIAMALNNAKMDKQLKRLVSSSVRMDGLLNISFEDYMSVTLHLPSYTEQKHVADFIEKINERIAMQEKLLASLKKYKKGLLSTSFADAASWRKKKLGDMCCIRTGKLDANAMVHGGKYPFFTCAREHYTIDSFAFDTDALLISGNGANVGYIHHYTGKFNAYQRTYVLDQFSENIDYVHVFLDRFLSSRIDAEKKAGNTPYIVLSTLSDMEIYLPEEATMKKIIEIFARVDEHIEKSKQILECFISLRKGLMQQLFI